jgi:membrane-associated phospholipid phosphatase
VSLDLDVLRLARTRGHSPTAERVVGRFSSLGEHGAAWVALGIVGAAADRGRRDVWARAVGVVALTYAANTALKLVVRRSRPALPGLPALVSTPTQLSFPSAHAATSFAGARLYSRAGAPAGPLYAFAAALTLSRLYLGVHYPSDLLAGALLGTALATLLSSGGDAS